MAISIFRAYLRRQDGATAVEFSLIAVPLVMLMFGLIEICMVFTKQGVLEYATLQAARKIRTGQVQEGGDPEQAFQDALCESASFLLDCNDIQYDVQEMDDFAEASEEPDPVFDEDGELVGAVFEPGESSTIILIRTVHRHPILTPMMQPLLSNGGQSTSRIVMSSVVLQTEPYEFNN